MNDSTAPHCSSPKKLTDLRHVNLFSTDVTTTKGAHPWTFASRKEQPGRIAEVADAAVVIAVHRLNGEARLVLTREFRAPLGSYELSVPSGLIDRGETAADAAKREMKEETGLLLDNVVHVSPPLASSAGLTDETVSLVYGEATGIPSREHLESHEDIDTRFVTVDEIRQILAAPTDVISSRVYPILVAFAAAGKIELPKL